MIENVQSYTLTRRNLLGAAALIVPNCSAAPARDKLRLRPPLLQNPTRIVVSDEMLRYNRHLHLEGVDQDWVIELPRDRYLEYPLSIHGHDKARHIVIIGGGIKPRPLYNSSTMRLLSNSDWAVYALRGFRGATGGVFRFKVQEGSYISNEVPPETPELPWNATPDQIHAALELAAGRGSVKAVDGPNQPGGPWKIVPANGPLLGRPVLDTSGLHGKVEQIKSNAFHCAASVGLRAMYWRGTLHVEGVHVGGDHVCDGINIENPNAGAIAQFANVHADPRFHPFHDDWVHGDGAQFYLGPSISRMENVDLVSIGANGFIAQPLLGQQLRPLEALHDWWFRNCHFRALQDDRGGRTADASTACFRWELNRPARLDQHWDCEEVYCSRARASDGALLDQDPLEKYYWYRGSDQANLKVRSVPPSGFFADPASSLIGPRYISPGYWGSLP